MLDKFIHKYLRVPYQLHVHADKNSRTAKATVVLLHGMGNSGASWDEIAKRLPSSVRVISIDLLGFGTSPSPRWLKYNIAIQARSVMATLLRMRIGWPVVFVGHSMGSLAAVEITKRYPLFVKSLILCSPPFYTNKEHRTLLPDQTKVLKDFYRYVLKNPQQIVNGAPLAASLNIVSNAFHVTEENVDVYMAALESSILHQTSFEDAQKIRKPMHIIHGMFDLIVIKKNLETIVKKRKNADLSVILAGHELMGAYVPAVVKAIKAQTASYRAGDHS